MTMPSIVSDAVPSSLERASALGLSAVPSVPDARARTTLDDPCETALYAELVRLSVKTFMPQRVLDVGCGSGVPTLAAARAGARRVTGLDIDAHNVELAREAVRCAALERRVTIVSGSWEDVCKGRIDVGGPELLVSNPPYVPSGEGTAVDGGPTGTRMLHAIIEHVPEKTEALALLFGSLCDPLAVLSKLAEYGFGVVDLYARSVPFGRYTSRPETLTRLLALRRQRRAYFCDVETMKGHAPYAYLTLGVMAKRRNPSESSVHALTKHVEELLMSYQMYGPALFPNPHFVSIMP